MNDIRVCELFAGIGGFRYGFEKASERFTTVFANELDKYAASIYRCNWPDGSLREGDITQIRTCDVPDFDLLCGGFPCQSFSMAGKRQGLRDPRGQMFQEILRFTKEKRPKMLLFENVPGLLSIDYGRVFEAMLRSLGEFGYVCEWQIFDSQFFGVPQQRRRVFIVGYSAELGRGRGTVFPIGQSDCVGVEAYEKDRIVSSTLTVSYGVKQNVGGNTFLIQPRPTNKEADQVRLYINKAPTLQARMGTGGGNVPYVLREGQALRRLSLVECERLQGFPDNHTKYGFTVSGESVEVSKTQRYKCLGNAVTTNVVRAIGGLIVDFLGREVVQ